MVKKLDMRRIFLKKGTKRAGIFMIGSSVLLLILNFIFTVENEVFYYYFAIFFIIFGIILLVIRNKEIKVIQKKNSRDNV